MRIAIASVLAACIGCFDFSGPQLGTSGDFCRADKTCDAGLQCDTGNRCTNACGALRCAPLGLCDHTGERPSCFCSTSAVDDHGDCVEPCHPTTHATTACSDGDVYWFDSCNSREDVASACGARGCLDAVCGTTTLTALGESAAGWGYERLLFDIDVDGVPLIGGLYPTYFEDNRTIDLMRWSGASWDSLLGTNVVLFVGGVADARLVVDPAGRISLAWCNGLSTVDCTVKVSEWTGSRFLNYGGVALMSGKNEGLDLEAGIDGHVTVAWTNITTENVHNVEIREWTGAWRDIAVPFTGENVSLARFDGLLALAETLGSAAIARVYAFNDPSWSAVGGGEGGAESLVVGGYEPVDTALAVSQEKPVVGLVVRAVANGQFRPHVRMLRDGGWHNLGAAPEPGVVASLDVHDIRTAAGPLGEIAVAYLQTTAEGGRALFLKLWRGEEWLDLNFGGELNGLTPHTSTVTGFDVQVGGARLCVGWTLHPAASSTTTSALVCGWL